MKARKCRVCRPSTSQSSETKLEEFWRMADHYHSPEAIACLIVPALSLIFDTLLHLRTWLAIQMQEKRAGV